MKKWKFPWIKKKIQTKNSSIKQNPSFRDLKQVCDCQIGNHEKVLDVVLKMPIEQVWNEITNVDGFMAKFLSTQSKRPLYKVSCWRHSSIENLNFETHEEFTEDLHVSSIHFSKIQRGTHRWMKHAVGMGLWDMTCLNQQIVQSHSKHHVSFSMNGIFPDFGMAQCLETNFIVCLKQNHLHQTRFCVYYQCIFTKSFIPAKARIEQMIQQRMMDAYAQLKDYLVDWTVPSTCPSLSTTFGSHESIHSLKKRAVSMNATAHATAHATVHATAHAPHTSLMHSKIVQHLKQFNDELSPWTSLLLMFNVSLNVILLASMGMIWTTLS